MSNFPPGVNSMHPHFNPPTCPKCGDELIEDEVVYCAAANCDWEAPEPDPDIAYEQRMDK